jgi:hypothetical protein
MRNRYSRGEDNSQIFYIYFGNMLCTQEMYLFNCISINSNHVRSNGRVIMNNDWQEIWKEAVEAVL